MKRKIEVLGNHGAYKDAKLIRKHLKNQQKAERLAQTEQSRGKLLLKQQLLLQQHQKEVANLLKKHES